MKNFWLTVCGSVQTGTEDLVEGIANAKRVRLVASPEPVPTGHRFTLEGDLMDVQLVRSHVANQLVNNQCRLEPVAA